MARRRKSADELYDDEYDRERARQDARRDARRDAKRREKGGCLGCGCLLILFATGGVFGMLTAVVRAAH